ncbi:MAG TPA: nucleotidyltransferase family protein [Limnochordales bacterium]
MNADVNGRIWAVVLAAGQSRRMGGATPKVLELVGGEPMVCRAVRAALRAGVVGVVVVAGPHPERVAEAVRQAARTAPAVPVQVRPNPDFAGGMASSLQQGLASLPDEAGAALVVLADQPLVGPELLRKVMQAGRNACAAACRYPDGHPGPPCLLKRELWPKVMILRGDQGARTVLRELGEGLALVACPPGELLDVDTPEQLAEARARLGRLPQQG